MYGYFVTFVSTTVRPWNLLAKWLKEWNTQNDWWNEIHKSWSVIEPQEFLRQKCAFHWRNLLLLFVTTRQHTERQSIRNGVQRANETLPRTYTAPCIYSELLTSKDLRCVSVNVSLRGFPRLSTPLQKCPILRCWSLNRSCWRCHSQAMDSPKYSGNWGLCAAERHLITSWNTRESPLHVFNYCKTVGDILHNVQFLISVVPFPRPCSSPVRPLSVLIIYSHRTQKNLFKFYGIFSSLFYPLFFFL